MSKTRQYATVGIMLALILAFQAMNMPQLITGCIVNAVLVFALLYIGLNAAIMLSILSPIGAFLSGILPSIMLPLLGIVAIGNILLVVSLKSTNKNNYYVRLLVPSMVKSLFIGLMCYIIAAFNFFYIPDLFLMPFALSQLVTSIVGIILAYKAINVCNLEYLNGDTRISAV